jgi:DNA (cytosine-5)-methyltransferase 1
MADGNIQQMDLPIRQELVVDLFAGGGGASLGIARAYREPDVAVNHNPIAVAVHRANHPETKHYTCDVFEIDPIEATGGQPVALLWASPDCRHHSKAKGGKPRSKRIRGLAWVVVKWAAACRPRIIMLENVEEFADWGPLTADGKPCPARKGMTFRRWVRQLENLGYELEHREIVASDLGAKTIRKRLYVVARRDGRPIVWPAPTHHKAGADGRARWRSAAECIDWSIAGRSIFDRPKPLAHNTQVRIAKGLWRYTLSTEQPFIVTNTTGHPGAPISEPLRTVTTGGHHALVEPRLAPVLTEFANSSSQRVFAADEPLRTICAQVKGGHFALASASLIQSGYGERAGQAPRVLDLSAPLGTVVAGGVKHAVALGHLTHLTHQGDRSGHSLGEPLRTVTCANRGEQALVAAHVTKFRANSVGSSAQEPLHTVTAGGDMQRPAGAAHAMGVVAAHFEQANGGFYDGDGRSCDAPLSTICTSGANQRLVTAYLVKYYSEGGQWQACDEPMHTVPTKDRLGLVQAVQVPISGMTDRQLAGARNCAQFLRKHLPEHFTTDADLVLVFLKGGWWVMVDITLRMLEPRELARAQGFPDDYHLEAGLFSTPEGDQWKSISKTDQVRLIGNSVCPDVAEALVKANAADLIKLYARSAA